MSDLAFDPSRISDAVSKASSEFLIPTYRRYPVEFVRGENCTLWDVAGNEYLDCLAGLSVVSVGHCRGEVTAAVCEQMAKLVHVSNIFYTAPQFELAKRIHDLAGWGRVFFSNSGAEANECALKLARRYGNLSMNGATAVVSLKKSFHGRTMGTLAMTAQPEKHEGFEPMLGEMRYVESGDEEALESALDGACAVFVEVIQGEGGVLPVGTEYLKSVREMCDSRGALMVVDEVQTGLCRTGNWLAFEAHGFTPDIYTLGKALGNGLPIAATVARDDLAELMGPGTHGTTMGGGPVTSSAALAVLGVMESENLHLAAAQAGAALRERLEAIDGVESVRGEGLLLAAELEKSSAEVVEAALGHGLVVNAVTSTAVRFAPPLTIGTAEIDAAAERFEKSIRGAAA
ncbi:MAG: aspartate aminotransferase family protein [Acidobacteria bacterium]|nr:MAG: aspartate aminotransferase family protein [Acidobacteriota bacterium]